MAPLEVAIVFHAHTYSPPSSATLEIILWELSSKMAHCFPVHKHISKVLIY